MTGISFMAGVVIGLIIATSSLLIAIILDSKRERAELQELREITDMEITRITKKLDRLEEEIESQI